ncbi:MAG: tetratricopeptide repeat protein [Leptolyngbyaceae cyanobacterium SM2_5_2]|nr:tetratricopeptide repeat protein [Leptolyngbyaceae cyanobacterium SM2_5_2]
MGTLLPLSTGLEFGRFKLPDQGDPRPEAGRCLTDAIAWFQVGNATVPYQEFGHSNLGWLQLENQQPEAARDSFRRSIALIPAKPGVFFGLGFSCLQLGDTDCAIDALALELIRHPALLTSPLWQLGQFAELYEPVTSRLEALYGELLTQHSEESSLISFLHQGRGTLRWWLGNLPGAAADWEVSAGSVQQALLTWPGARWWIPRPCLRCPPSMRSPPGKPQPSGQPC